MLYNQPYGISDPNAPYINGNPSTGTMGSIPPAASIEFPQRELVNIITLSGGFTPTNADLQQVAKAIQAGKINYSVDTGTADAMVATLVPTPPTYTNGMRIWVRKMGATNTTTTPTLNVNAMGPKTIMKRNTSPLGIGDLQSNGLYEYVYDGVGFRVMSLLLSDVAYLANNFGGIPSNTLVTTAPSVGVDVTFTWTVPPGVTRCYVRLWGAGGGGGGQGGGNGHGGSGAGAGGYCEKTVKGLIPGGTVFVTVGSPGMGGTGAVHGTAGRQTLFGSHCYANGGINGMYGSTGTYQASTGTIGQINDNGLAIGHNGDVNLYGGRGQQGGIAWMPAVWGIGGGGGNSPNGGSGGNSTTSGGQHGDTPGGGGAGAGGGTGASSTAGNGGGGACIIQWNDPPDATMGTLLSSMGIKPDEDNAASED